MKPHLAHHPRERGVALVTTVIVVAVLAVVAVAFMQSTTTDRLSSRSVANYTRAKLAAEGGAAAAEAMIADLVKRYPDSATVWQNIGGGAPNGTNNEATVLYLRAQASATNLGASPAQFGGAVTILAQPLVSRVGATPETFNTNPLPLSNVVSSVPFPADTAVNINATNAARPEPFVGSRSSTNPGSPITAAQWIYLTQNGGPTNATNPYIARYAFWVEDESFKVNVNVITNGPRGNASLGLSAAEARLNGSWGTSTNDELNSAAGNVIPARASLAGQFPTALTAALPASLTNPTTAAELRFLTTTHSAGLDLSRGGFKRFNINSITNGIAGPGDAVNVRAGLDRILAVITNTNSMPSFGQRFYRATNGTTSTINSSTAVTAAHANIYLQKLAANLLDYIDANDQPTVVNNDAAFSIRTGRPSYGFDALGGGLDGANSVAAMGVEAIPRLQEYAIHARIRSLRHTASDAESFGFVVKTNSGAVNPTSADFEIWLDHYFEFWHPGTNIIRLTNAFLKIYDQPAFGPSGKISGPLGQAGRETSEIPIGNVTFRPGRTVVLTTARSGEVSSGANASQNGFALIDTTKMASAADVVSLTVPDADRKFTGTTTATNQHVYNSQGSYGPSVFTGNTEPYNRLFEVNLLPRSTSITDYQSAVLIGNDNGVLESFVGLPIAASTPGTPAISLCVSNGYIRDGMANLGAGNNDNVRGGSLRGNSSSTTTPSSTEGDPRALNEQLRFLNYASGMANTDQTRFYSTISSNQLPDGSTMGLPNANYVDPKRWVDVSSTEANATNAPLIVRNGPMQSIGELGHITDPARVAGPGGIEFSRGGGRTLRVGQPEHRWWYDTNQNRPSRTWASWRLADIFTTSAASNGTTAATTQGVLTNSLGVVRGGTNTNGAVVSIPGLINPNGALRDNGAALRAALFGLSFQPLTGSGTLGVPNLAGLAANVTNVSTNLVRRLTTVTGTDLPANTLNPLWERGEISELALLNSGTGLAAGVNMSNVFDRGREELVRRSIEMITTRGSVFSVYAVGQALQVVSSRTNILSTARLKQTFEIIPQFATADAFLDSFNPAQPAVVSRRFAAPTNYTVRVLATSYD